MVNFKVIYILLVCHLKHGVHEFAIENILGLVVSDDVVGHQVGPYLVVTEQLAFFQEYPHLAQKLILCYVELPLNVLELGADRLHFAIVEY